MDFSNSRDMTDYDSRIIDLYDEDNPDGPDHEFYRALADRLNARSILDVGCGTGLLTVAFAQPGRTVIGVDPSPTMINYARRREDADRVTWIEGDTRAINSGQFDLAVMTGNVAQHIPDDEWERTLNNLRRLVKTGAVLAFESRNPAARAWVDWDQEAPTTRETMHGPLREWCDAREGSAGQVHLRFHNHFEATDESVLEDLTLTFRDRGQITSQLVSVGFEIVNVWGDWQRTPFDGTQPVMVVEARARGASR